MLHQQSKTALEGLQITSAVMKQDRWVESV
jgi:hypothetical protein